MSTAVIAACKNYYTAMTFPVGVTKPTLYFGMAPTRGAANTRVRLPWVVLREGPRRTWNAFGSGSARPNAGFITYEIAKVTFQSYAVQLTDAQNVADAIKWGSTAVAEDGFDFGVLTLSPSVFTACRRVDETTEEQLIQTENVALCYVVRLTYEIEMQTTQ